jgi:MFS family permease
MYSNWSTHRSTQQFIAHLQVFEAVDYFLLSKCLLLVNCLAFVAGALIYIQYFPTLIFFRLCQGFCVGFYSAIAPLIIKELAPNEISGTLGSYSQLLVCLGVFIGCFFTYILIKATGD